jgi:hypothetical protein
MACMTCFGSHTNPCAAIRCYRRVFPAPLVGAVTEKLGGAMGIADPPHEVSVNPQKLTTSKTVLRHGRASRSGRPRVPVAEQRRKARERQRAYRARLTATSPRRRGSKSTVRATSGR